MDAPNTSQLPFVSAVCITGKSKYHVEKLLPQAIKSFREQTYPVERRELLMVADGCLDELCEVWPIELPRIRTLLQDESSLGALRNAGLKEARGDLVIQWDDDDWHHPQRIAQQVEAFVEHGGRPCFLKRQLTYDVQRDVAFVREFPNTFIHGSILHANTPDLKPYPEGGKEEDTIFIRQWPEHLVMDNPPELYVRFFHGDEHNTWDRAHVMREAADYRPGAWAISKKQAEYLEYVLSHYQFPVNEQLTPHARADRRFRPNDYPILKTPEGLPPAPVLPPVHVPPPSVADDHTCVKEPEVLCMACQEVKPWVCGCGQAGCPDHGPPSPPVDVPVNEEPITARTCCASMAATGVPVADTGDLVGVRMCLAGQSIPVLTAEGSLDGGVIGQRGQDGQGVVPSAEDEDGRQGQGNEKQRSPFVVS